MPFFIWPSSVLPVSSPFDPLDWSLYIWDFPCRAKHVVGLHAIWISLHDTNLNALTMPFNCALFPWPTAAAGLTLACDKLWPELSQDWQNRMGFKKIRKFARLAAGAVFGKPIFLLWFSIFFFKNNKFMTFWQEMITLTCPIRRGMKFVTQTSPILSYLCEWFKFELDCL